MTTPKSRFKRSGCTGGPTGCLARWIADESDFETGVGRGPEALSLLFFSHKFLSIMQEFREASHSGGSAALAR